ncbi:DsbA family protein [Pontibacter sp. SGAir0037]|uniref:DsbA family oxidoreductase n=1 Tax=Pontibacter sp. SGAir0037 TaxID=2571030 RepID=UPI0010CD2D39|nr:DsbA family oxidoreductase [Pontibacter sp. SGAir0037]QCR21349.1 disulfide bond formation protein DsbA [Pontibacter sp. SGAir0037]
MKVDIWSDIMCPFCYIGKRKFEKALEQFQHKDEVEVEWHSFQLQPDAQHVPGKDTYDFLAEIKGTTREQAKEMNNYVAGMAREVGLQYDFDNLKVANTFDSHRLIHLAAKHGLQDKAKERLLAAHFLEGQNVQDQETLVALGSEIGLEAAEVREMLSSENYAYEVKMDIQQSRNLGINGVPFFVLNNKYGISGAQPSEVFLKALEQTWAEENQAS